MAQEPNNDLTVGFETETCGRCCGSGHYSFNMMDGTVCYGCSGAGVKRTKRGQAARSLFEASLLTPLADVQVGWLYRGRSGKWFTVESIGVGTSHWGSKDATTGELVWNNYIDLAYGRGNSIGFPKFSDTVPAQPNIERVKELKAAALAYQQTLNERGKVLKRARVAA
jgi:hypothetical protein